MNAYLNALLKPRGIAVVGSVKEGKIARQLIAQLLQGGFEGDLCAVNPRAESPAVFAANRT
jgi:acyl-CoA synthetase (NDP forming)